MVQKSGIMKGKLLAGYNRKLYLASSLITTIKLLYLIYMYQSIKTLEVKPLRKRVKYLEFMDLVGIFLLVMGSYYILQGVAYLISKIIFN